MSGESEPKVYSIVSGTNFADALAAELLRRYGDAPLDMSRVTVLLPTRRGIRALTEAFLHQGDGVPMILPVMKALGDIEGEEVYFDTLGQEIEGIGSDVLNLPPAITPLKRRLMLTQLIIEESQPYLHGDPVQALHLADELAHFLDQVHTERVSFDAIVDVVPEDYSAHWQKTLRFLSIVIEQWPAMLKREACLDPIDRRNRLLEARTTLWREAPPSDPVIAAGSTGSIPATGDLLRVIARLPDGAVVLPGLDQHMDDESWDALDVTHPQFGMKQLLARIGCKRDEVKPWPSPFPCSTPSGRAKVLSIVLRPAGAVTSWVGSPPPIEGSLDGLSVIESVSPREEAGTIALFMREALEVPERTAALVTPDRDLARRVAAELRRWNIDVDDSAGQLLSNTPPGILLRLIAALAVENVGPVALLSCLKHPLVAGGLKPTVFRSRVRRLELSALRGLRPAPGFGGIIAALVRTEDKQSTFVTWFEKLAQAFSPLATEMAKSKASLEKLVHAHVAFSEFVSASDKQSGAERLWSGEAGEAAGQFIAELLEAAPLFPLVNGSSYLTFFEAALANRVVRQRYGQHPRLNIWGPLEARLQNADLLILGGLNEGTWPPEPTADPWMSRPMRAKFGLSSPDRRIGLSAHDFVQAASAPRVILSRSTSIDGTPAVPARWLLRLEAYLAASNQPWPTERGMTLTHWNSLLDSPDKEIRISRPAPMPPVEVRPRRLSVTQIETWMRDPYSIYARHILKLKPLEPLEANPGAAERGTLIHRALDLFISETLSELPTNALEVLLAIGEEVFNGEQIHSGILAVWWPRFVRIARWFVENERIRREDAVPIGGEIKGQIKLEAPGGEFTLTAIADRIDQLADGSLVLVDYKTGSLPQKRDVAWGFSPQLPLEAVIANAGGFENIPAKLVTELAYWRLTGGVPSGEVWNPSANTAHFISTAREGLEHLIAVFDDPSVPYVAIPRPKYSPRFNNYAHLARVAEWAEHVSGGEL